MNTVHRHLLTTALVTRSASYDEASGTVEAVYSTGARVERIDERGASYFEELVISSDAIIADRLDAGVVHLIHDHIPYGLPAGRVISHRIDGDSAIAVIKLSDSPEAAGVVADIRSGVIRSVSVGYLIHASESADEDGKTIVRVTRWEPIEISLTVMPADPAAQIRSKPKTQKTAMLRRVVKQPTTPKGKDMAKAITRAKPGTRAAGADVAAEVLDETTVADAAAAVAEAAAADVTAADVEGAVEEAVTAAVEEAIDEVVAEIEAEAEGDDETVAADAVAAERRRSAAISTIAARNGLSQSFVTRHVTAGTSVAAIRSAVIETRAARSAAPISTARAQITRDESVGTRAQAEAAVYSLISSTPARDADVGAFRGMSLVGIARRAMGSQANGRSDREVVQLALRSGVNSSSDFSFTSATGGAIERRVREISAGMEMDLQPLIRDTLVANFLPVQTYSIGGFPELKETVEGAEYEAGSVNTESGEFRIKKFGRILTLSFESIVNDDLRLLDTAIRGVATKGVGLRNRAVRAAFSAKLADGKTMFHASRGNLVTDALNVDGLSKARAILRKVKDVDGDPMGLTPKFLVVGPDLETDAQRLISPITAAIYGEVNPFAASLDLIVDPLMEGTDWMVAADPTYGDAIELADLRGYEGVRVEEIPNHIVDGISYRARAFAGAHPTGWRGFVKSTGVGA